MDDTINSDTYREDVSDQFKHQPAILPIKSHNMKQIEDPECEKLITILFMSHRIQAKLYKSDSIGTFIDWVSSSIFIFNLILMLRVPYFIKIQLNVMRNTDWCLI